MVKSVKRIRDRAMASLYKIGMTTGQISEMDVDQFDQREGVVNSFSPRLRRPVVIDLEREVADELSRWVSARSLLAPETCAVFITLNKNGVCATGSRIGAHSIRCALKGLNGRAGRD